jgi:hypothetical protein
MAASSVRIDRPVERQVVAGDVVDDRLGFRFDERDPAELRGVKGSAAELEELVCHLKKYRTYVRLIASPSQPRARSVRPIGGEQGSVGALERLDT